MEYALLGKSGLKVSKIIMGGMGFGSPEWSGSPWVLGEEEGLKLLKAAYDAGITTWDTADWYSNGESERIIGKALKKFDIKRRNVTIMTKIYCATLEGTNHYWPITTSKADKRELLNSWGLSRKHIIEAVDDSLRRLDVEYIDVLQIHRFDLQTPVEEIMRALHDVVAAGKVRYIGASSMCAWQFMKLQHVAELHGWTRFVSMQNLYNVAYREEEREMIPYCKDAGVALIPWSPLARGILARPIGQSTLRGDEDKFIEVVAQETEPEIIRRVEKVAKDKGVSMAMLSIAWTLHKGCFPIIGPNTQERIDEGVKALEVKLTEDEMKYLEEPYKPRQHLVVIPPSSDE